MKMVENKIEESVEKEETPVFNLPKKKLKLPNKFSKKSSPTAEETNNTQNDKEEK